jgi:hypothetical protein
MRSFFAYLRLKADYSLLSCSVTLDRLEPEEHVAEEVFAALARQGIRVKAKEILRMHLVSDPRNTDCPDDPAVDARLRRAVAEHPGGVDEGFTVDDAYRVQ